jgi:hypothetical protein
MQATDIPIPYGNTAASTLDSALTDSTETEKSFHHYAQATSTPVANTQELGFEEWLAVNNEGEGDTLSDPYSLLTPIDQMGLETWLETAEDDSAPCLMFVGIAENLPCTHMEESPDLVALIDRLGFEAWLLDSDISFVSQNPTVVLPALPDEIRELPVEAQIQTSVYHSYMQGIEWVGSLYHEISLKEMQALIVQTDDPLILRTWQHFTVKLLGEKKRFVEEYPQLHQEGFFLGVVKGIEELTALKTLLLTAATFADESQLMAEPEAHSGYYAYVLGSAWVLGQYYHLQEMGQHWDFSQPLTAATLRSVWHEILFALPAEKKRWVTTNPAYHYDSFCAGVLRGMNTFQALNNRICSELNTTPLLVAEQPAREIKEDEFRTCALTANTEMAKEEDSAMPTVVNPVEQKESAISLPRVALSEQSLPRQSATRARVLKKPRPFPIPHPLMPGKDKKDFRVGLEFLPLPEEKPRLLTLREKGHRFFYHLFSYPLFAKRRLIKWSDGIKKQIVSLSTSVRSSVSAFQKRMRTIGRTIVENISTTKSVLANLFFSFWRAVNEHFSPTNLLSVSPYFVAQQETFFQGISTEAENEEKIEGIAQTIHRPAAQDFSRIAVLNLSFLPINRQVMLAVNQVAPELDELHLQGSQFKEWEGAFIRKVMTGQFASLRLLNVRQSNLSEHSLLQILQAVEQNKLPRLEKLGMDLFSFPLAQRYSQLLFARKYTSLNQLGQTAPTPVSFIKLDLQDKSYTPAIILRILLTYLHLGLLQSIVDIQLAGRTLTRPIIALLSAFPALKVLNIADSHYGSCRAFALFSQLNEKGAWNGINLQAAGSVFSKALSKSPS